MLFHSETMSWLKKIESYTYIKTIFGIIRTMLFMPRITLVVPYIEKDGKFVLCPINIWIGYLVTTTNIFVTGFVLIKSSDLTKLKTNPYYLLGYLRILIYYLHVFISTLHVNRNHAKVVHIINQFKCIESKVQLSESHLKIMTRLSVLQLAYGGFIWSVRFFLATHSAADKGVIIYCRKIIDGFIKHLPEVNQFIFVDFLLTITFFVVRIHQKLEKISKDQNYFSKNKIDSAKPDDLLTWDKINGLRLLYGQIHDLKECLNEVYAIHNLLTFGYILMELVFVIFLNITITNLWKPYGENLTLINFQQIIFILLTNVIKLYIVTFVSQFMTRKMKRTGILVHRLYSKTKDGEVRSEVVPGPIMKSPWRKIKSEDQNFGKSFLNPY